MGQVRITFDLETNGLRNTPWEWNVKRRENPPELCTKIHCLVLKERGKELEEYHDDPTIRRDGTLKEGYLRLGQADVLVGHNIQNYDLPVLNELASCRLSGVVRDTLIMSRMGYTTLRKKDDRLRPRGMPESLYGLHTLRAWGYRIGLLKGHVNDTEDWSTFDEAMLTYCGRDVEVNEKLDIMFEKSWAGDIDEAVQVEHEFCTAIQSQIDCGWYIDEEKAWELTRELEIERMRLEEDLLTLFPGRWVEPTHILNPNKTCAADKWMDNPDAEKSNEWWNPKALKTKKKFFEFKPSSDMQVIWNLNQKYGWEPTIMTDKGNPKFGEDVISGLGFDETKDLVHYSQVTGRLSELLGNSGYLTLLWDDGRLHGSLQHCGAVTHRCTHQRPNMGNVTGVKNPYGKEMRELFTVPDDSYCIVGADASGLELRMLGHSMAKYDDGDYAKEVVEGDAHLRNSIAMGLRSHHPQGEDEEEHHYFKRVRNSSKGVIYAHNYGSGNETLGEACEPKGLAWPAEKRKKVGARVRKSLLAGLPALKQTIEGLKKYWKVGYTVTGLDGRIAEVLKAYICLNTQLQMNGAIVVKWATVLVHREARKRWGPPSKDGTWCMVGHVHDEYNFQVKKEIAHEFGKLAVDSFANAGKLLSVSCGLAGEYQVGNSWAEVH